jgi:CheY-like chemotaxis protein
VPVNLLQTQEIAGMSWQNADALSVQSLPRCLVIDPDQSFADILARIVASHGFETTIIAEAFAGLRELRSQTYDIVLFDLSSPEGDARFVLDELRREMPHVLDRTVIVSTNPLVASGVTVGVPVVGKSDLKPLLGYLSR